MEERKKEIILFENQGVKLEVNLKDETVWLNRQQMATLFNRDVKTIGKHINNALARNWQIFQLSQNLRQFKKKAKEK